MPAAYSDCFSVASTTSTDARSSFSNYGTWVEIAAPGSSIYSAWLNGGYSTISGTSMATPHVAGAAGLLASQGLTRSQIWQRLCDSATDIAGMGTSWTCGRLNLREAGAPSGPPPSPPPPPPGPVVNNGGFESAGAGWTQSSAAYYTLVDTVRPRTGTWGAWLAGYDRAQDILSQTITIPSGGGTLRYWWYMTSGESTTYAYDYLFVDLYTSSGVHVARLSTLSNTAARNAWYQDAVSLNAWAGQTLSLRFTGFTDGSIRTDFHLDDVSVT